MIYFLFIYSVGISIYAYMKHTEIEQGAYDRLRLIDLKNQQYSELFDKYKKLQETTVSAEAPVGLSLQEDEGPQPEERHLRVS